MSPASEKGLWIEVRDSSNGERSIAIYEAPAPASRADRERFLNRLVPRIIPGAALRTYAGGTATFVRDALLIKAHYGAVRDGAELLPLPPERLEPAISEPGQGSLFAA